MAALSGTLGSVVVYDGTTPTFVGELAEWSLDITNSPVEATAFGDQWARFVPSIRNATGSFQGNFDGVDGGQKFLVGSILSGTAIALDLMMDGSIGFSIASAFITSMSPSISQTGKGDVSYNFQNSAEVTYLDGSS